MDFLNGMHPPSKMETEYYERLKLSREASDNDIKKAFRKTALKTHPDRGGDAEEFKKVQEAYEVLSDPEKRRLYDSGGKAALESEGRAPSGFDRFFGARSRGHRPRKGRDIVHNISASLEDLYRGKSKKIALTRDVPSIEEPQDGWGKSHECGTCGGTGILVQVRQIGPGMIQQVQGQCQDCQGAGFSVPMKQERKLVELHIEPGMRSGTKIRMAGQANVVPGSEPGDIVFIINEDRHPLFERRGDHLVLFRKITLAQALCGYEFSFTHLDGRPLHIKSRPGDIISPGSVKIIRGEGMPTALNPFLRGELYLRFEVVFPAPDSFDRSRLLAISQALGDMPKEMHAFPESTEHYEMADFRGHLADVAGNSPESDGEDGSEGVQCAQA